MMKPLQVYVDAEEAARFDAWSRARGLTKSQAVRLLIRAATRRATEGNEPLLGMSGSIHGLPEDLSTRIDRYLEETYLAQTPSAPRRRRPVARVRR